MSAFDQRGQTVGEQTNVGHRDRERNPGHRVIEFRYETGYDDGEAASGYYVARDSEGRAIARGNFSTDGSGTFRCSGWPKS